MRQAVNCAVLLLFPLVVRAQTPEVHFIADTVVVEADGTAEADPDLATLTFRIFSQDREIKHAYDAASQSMQHIAALALSAGLPKQDVTSGVLEVRPFYEGDRRKRARSYAVQGEMILKVRDFSKIAVLLDGSIDDGVSDFRSLTYSVADDEAAKKQAVANAVRRAIGRADIALEQRGQKLCALRYMTLDVNQLYGVEQTPQPIAGITLENEALSRDKSSPSPAPPPPPPAPEKITVRATVQCAFHIQ